ncbi:hypothetical protein [Streptomyces sp. NPDC003015]
MSAMKSEECMPTGGHTAEPDGGELVEVDTGEAFVTPADDDDHQREPALRGADDRLRWTADTDRRVQVSGLGPREDVGVLQCGPLACLSCRPWTWRIRRMLFVEALESMR